jgi:hypothetical protein
MPIPYVVYSIVKLGIDYTKFWIMKLVGLARWALLSRCAIGYTLAWPRSGGEAMREGGGQGNAQRMMGIVDGEGEHRIQTASSRQDYERRFELAVTVCIEFILHAACPAIA